MNAQPTITLRDVGRRLARLPSSKTGGIADGKLLGLLKAGELKAGFYFPGPYLSWIPISPSYWAGISSDQFTSIRRSDKKNLRGTFKVWPAPGSEDTELGVLMELEVGHGETEVYARVQA
jgi:hypothetical protein